MENRKTHTSPDETEIIKMFWVHARSRIYLERVVVVRRVLEQAVEWVEHLVRKQEEEFTVE